jgi:hypothetical protein
MASMEETRARQRERRRDRQRVVALVLIAALVFLALPGPAAAHGPPSPVATSYVARLSRVPAGLDAKVVNGDLRMWLRVPKLMTVVVLDYRGAPYLRFSRSGVQVNENSSMYYLNQAPVPATPPTNLSAGTPPHWRQVSSGHTYNWHDGRLHALATVALSPATKYVGRWSIPLEIDGRLASISGGVWHRASPPIVWFWPIIVMLACALAAWRSRRPALDARLARMLSVAALLGAAVAGSARELYGRPTVPAFHVVELAAILAFAAWGVRQVLVGRPGYFSFFTISLVALWEGVELIPTLTHGYTLTAVPGFVARASAVLCLGAGASLLLFVFRLVRPSAAQPVSGSTGRGVGDRVTEVAATPAAPAATAPGSPSSHPGSPAR